MKSLIDELRAKYQDSFWVQTVVDDFKIDVMVDGSMLYVDLTNNFIEELIARKDPHLFVVMNLVEEQARRKELEVLVTKQMGAGNDPVPVRSHPCQN
jgi:hypothetical protein